MSKERVYWHPIIEVGIVTFLAGVGAFALLFGTIGASITYFIFFGF